MINQKSIIFSVVALVLLLSFFGLLLAFLKKKFKVKFIPVFSGFIMFILFALILEPILHRIVLQPAPDGTIAMKLNNPILYMFYGAFAAGVFEEVSRFIGLTIIKKQYPEEETSIAYGFGHGGAELLIIGVATLISNIVLMISINQGNEQLIDSLPKTVIKTLINTPATHYLFVVIERMPVMFIQIALTLIVWHGIKHKTTFKILPLAIVIHAAIDLMSAAYQVGYIQNMLVLYVLLYFETFLLLVITKKYFWPYSSPLALKNTT